MCDRDLVTMFPQVVEEQHGPLPELMARALGVTKMRVIETGETPSGRARAVG
jgi:arginine deiminase